MSVDPKRAYARPGRSHAGWAYYTHLHRRRPGDITRDVTLDPESSKLRVSHGGRGWPSSGALEGEKFAHVLLDVTMPRKSSMDILPEIVAQRPDLAVITLTGIDDVCIGVKAMREGAFDDVNKPVSLAIYSAWLGPRYLSGHYAYGKVSTSRTRADGRRVHTVRATSCQTDVVRLRYLRIDGRAS